MMKKTKIYKIFTVILAMILCFNISILKPKAADVSITIALSASSVQVGGSVTATINVNGSNLSAYTLYVSYNSGVLQYNSGSGAIVNGGGGTVTVSGTGGGSVSLSFTAIANGSSSISTSGSDFLNLEGTELSVSHAGVTVSVAAPSSGNNENSNTTSESASNEAPEQNDDRSDNCNLKSLQISPGTLEPAFSPSTTSYFVQVEKDVTSMVVSAVTEDSKANTQVWGAGLIEPGENTVKITVTAENGAVKVYNIRVLAGEDVGDANVTIDDEFYKFADNQNVEGIPDGYTDKTITYKDWDVLAFDSPNKEITLVCLIDVEGEFKWFMYNAADESFIPYKEFSSRYNRYIILPIPEDLGLSDDFQKVELEIDGEKVEALKSTALNDNQLYLVYAMNIEGSSSLYVYDKAESSFMRYVPPKVEEPVVQEEATVSDATPSDVVIDTPDDKTDNNLLLYIVIGVSALAFLFLVLFIYMIAKNHTLKQKAQEAEDMVESLSGGRGVDRSVLEGEVKSKSTYNLEELKSGEEEKKPQEEGKIELPRGIKAVKNTSFVDAINNIEPIKFTENNEENNSSSFTNEPEEIPEIDITLPNKDVAASEKAENFLDVNDISFDIGYRPDEKERTFEEYAQESEEINNKLKENYNVNEDSAFGSNDKIDDTDK